MFHDKNNSLDKISTSKYVILELGIGKMKTIPNSIAIDYLDFPAVDIVADLNKGLSFLEDNSVDEIHSSHLLEHIEELELLLSEIHRVLKVGGKKVAIIPHFSNPFFYSDYTHKSFFGLYTFSYFSKGAFFKREVPKFYNNINFEINKIEIDFKSPFRGRNQFKKFLKLIFNSSKYMQELYEENFCYIFPAYQIKIELIKLL